MSYQKGQELPNSVQTARLGIFCYRLFVIGQALADIRMQKMPDREPEMGTIAKTVADVNHSIYRKTEVNQYDINILQVINVQAGVVSQKYVIQFELKV